MMSVLDIILLNFLTIGVLGLIFVIGEAWIKNKYLYTITSNKDAIEYFDTLEGEIQASLIMNMVNRSKHKTHEILRKEGWRVED